MHTHRRRLSPASGVALLLLSLSMIIGLSAASAQEVTEEPPVLTDPVITIPTESPQPEVTPPLLLTEEPTTPPPTEIPPETTPEVIVEPEPEATPEPQPEVTAEPQPEVTAEPQPEVTAEPQPTDAPTEAPTTPDPTEGLTLVLAADFELGRESLATDWTMIDVSAYALDDDTTAARFAAGSSLVPASALTLSDQRIDLVFNVADAASLQIDLRQHTVEQEMPIEIVTPPPKFDITDPVMPVPILSRDTAGYRLVADAAGLRLLRSDGTGYGEVAVSAGVTPLEWHTLSMVAAGNALTVTVDGVVALTFVDPTPLAAGDLAFNAGGDLLLDNIAVYDLSVAAPQPDVVEVEVEPEATEAIAPVDETPALSDAATAKLGGAFANVMTAHLSGDLTAADQIADNYFIERDDQGRYRLVLWAQAGGTGDALAALISTTDGTVNRVAPDHVEVYIAADALLPLINLDDVASVTLPQYAASLGGLDIYNGANDLTVATTAQRVNAASAAQTTGNIAPHSLDIIGATSWHAAQVTGVGSDVAVIAAGFASSAGNAELTGCVAGTPVGGNGTGNTGTQAAEVICDVAPDATVYLYSAGTITELDARLGDIQNRTGGNPIPDVIVITLDTGASTNAGVTNKINALTTNNNVVVVAAAGNSGSNGALRAQFGGGTGQMTIEASAGQIISYNWENTASNFPTRLLADETVIDSRSAPTGNTTHQYIVPASCGESCTLTLEITGDAPTLLNARVMGGSDAGVIIAGEGMSGVTYRPVTEVADLANVIAVGAACPVQADGSDRYQILPDSSIGDPDTNQDGNIKPNLVAPSRVSTSLAEAGPNCGTSGAGVGFDGTAASSAHVGGMAALLLSNNPMRQYFSAQPGGIPSGVRTYLMTRTIDLADDSLVPDGFDNVYGAGMAQLGNPSFNLNFQQNLTLRASLDPGSWIYVTSARLPSSTPDGSPTNPYTSIGYALEQAEISGADTVVLMPGEWTSSFAIPYDDTNLVSYDSVDLFGRPASNIWVNDNYFGLGGIYITGVDNVSVQGLVFIGARPTYTLNENSFPASDDATDPTLTIEQVTPLFIGEPGTFVAATTNITLTDNYFFRFDKPMAIIDVDPVTMLDNTWDSFEIAIVNNNGVETAAEPAVVMEIEDSGQTTGVYMEGNTFINNRIPFFSNIRFTPEQEPLLRIVRSQVEMQRTRFENNAAESIIMVNQWVNEIPFPAPSDKLNLETVIYSSLFAGNEAYGGLIHLYQNNQFRFVNNTVAANTIDDEEKGSVVIIGYNLTTFQQVADHRFDIHNNLFYFNDIGNSIINAEDPGINVGCGQIGGPSTTDDGFTHNWLAPSQGQGAGTCSPSFNDAGNNNIATTEWPPSSGNLLIDENNPEAAAAARAQFEVDNFFASFDPDNFYRLRPQPEGAAFTNPGVDVGDNTKVDEIIGTYDPLTDFDLIGAPRIQDRTEPIVDPFDGLVDLGAYELSNPEPVTVNVPTVELTPFNEDTPAFLFNLTDEADITGGFRPYSFEFAPPQVYDTDPNNVCLGQPFVFNADTQEVTYCPPPDFYTEGAPISIVVDYSVTGLLDTGTDNGSFEIRINPVNDGAPSVETEPNIVFSEVGSPAEFRLRPFATFTNNFFLSDPDMDDNAATPSDVDYPFTYSSVIVNPNALDGHNGNLFDTGDVSAALAAANSNGGIFSLVPNPGETGAYEFSYAVQDTDGQNTPGARTVRIIVAERLATIGLHDDASLDFLYSSNDPNGQIGWGAAPYNQAINNTLHYTLLPGASTDFTFAGDGFAVSLLFYNGGANYFVEIDVGDGNGFVDPRTIPGVTCNYAPGQTPTTSISVVGNYTFACRGLDSVSNDAVRTLRLSHAGGGGALVLDAIQVRGTGLGPGVYDNEDFAFDFGGTIGSANPDCTGQTGGTSGWYRCLREETSGLGVFFTTNNGASFTFTVDGDEVEAMLFHRTTYEGPTAGDFEVQVGDSTYTFSNDTPFYWDQPYFIGGIGSGEVEVTVTALNVGWTAFDYIELIGSTQGAAQGMYDLTDPRVRLIGDWFSYATPESADGLMHYSPQIDAAALLPVDGSAVDRVTIYHTNWGGQLRVCGSTCVTLQTVPPDGPRATTFRLSELGLTGNPNGVLGISIAGLWVGVDQIHLWSSTDERGPGQYLWYDAGLTYSDNWLFANLEDAVGGSIQYVQAGTAGTVSMNVDATTVDRIAVLHADTASFTTTGEGTLCRNTIDDCQPFDTDGSRVTLITADDLGFTQNIEQITLNVSAVADNPFLLEGVHLIGTEALAPGLYEHDDPTLTHAYAGRWIPYSDIPTDLRFGEVVYTFDPGALIGFNVDATASSQMVVYHTAYGGSASVCNDLTGDCETVTTTTNRQTVINLSAINAAGADVPISIRFTSPGAVFGFEGVELLPAATVLGPGTYQENTAAFEYGGEWGFYADPLAVDQGLYYALNNSSTMSFRLDATEVDYVAFMHADWLVEGVNGQAQLCPGTGTTGCESFTTNTRATFISVADLGLVGTDERVTLRVQSNWIGLDAVVLIGGEPGQGEGDYLLTDPNMTYVGVWPEFATAAGRAGAVTYSGDIGAAVTFPVNATSTDTVTVFHTQYGGTMQVCGEVDTNCQSVITDITNGRSSTFDATTLGLSGANARVTVRVLDGFIGFEGIQLSNNGAPAALTIGQYLYTDARLDVSNEWTSVENAAYIGGSLVYVEGSTGTIAFDVNAAASTSLTVLHAAFGGTGQVCEGSTTNCVDFTTLAGDRAFTVEFGAGAGQLDLTGTAAPVEIRGSSGFIGVEGVRVNGTTPPPLTPGLYAETAGELVYTLDDWFVYNASTEYGGRSMWTNTNDNGITLRMGTGNTPEEAVTGVVVFSSRYDQGADVEICVTRESSPAEETCITNSTAIEPASVLQGVLYQPMYGSSVVGLPPRNDTDTANETYTVTISKQGSASSWINVDAIAILGTTTGRLVGADDGSVTLFDEQDPSIIYAPEPLWIVGGGAAGLLNGTYAYTQVAGAVAQISIDGNEVTLLPWSYAAGSRDVRFCQGQSVLTETGVPCSNFSLNGVPARIPITLFGFGSGETDLTIENREPNGGLLLDGIVVE